MTQYLLSVHHADLAYTEEEMQQIFADVDAFNSDLQASGRWVFGGGLEPVEAASVVDSTGEKPVVTDGPFVESKEHLGGFWIIEAADLAEAQQVASAGSKACRLPVEVRPFQAE